MTLYIWDKDTTPGKASCTGQCAQAWPPLYVTGTAAVGAGLTAAMFSTVTGPNGSKQLAVNGKPLYRWQADKAAGDTTGQDVNSFYVVERARQETRQGLSRPARRRRRTRTRRRRPDLRPRSVGSIPSAPRTSPTRTSAFPRSRRRAPPVRFSPRRRIRTAHRPRPTQGRGRRRRPGAGRVGRRSPPPTRVARSLHSRRRPRRALREHRGRQSRPQCRPARRGPARNHPSAPSTAARDRATLATRPESLNASAAWSGKRSVRPRMGSGPTSSTRSGRYTGTKYSGSHGARANGTVSTSGCATDCGSTTSPRTTRSWAASAATGVGGAFGARSAHVCVEAATSESGPSANRPPSSVSTAAAVLGRGVEREPVFGQISGRPHLPTAFVRGAKGEVAQRHERLPVAGIGVLLDESYQRVEIVRIDRVADFVHASGKCSETICSSTTGWPSRSVQRVSYQVTSM